MFLILVNIANLKRPETVMHYKLCGKVLWKLISLAVVVGNSGRISPPDSICWRDAEIFERVIAGSSFPINSYRRNKMVQENDHCLHKPKG